MTSRAESHWRLLGAAAVVGLLAGLVSAYLVVLVPLAGLDRFALAAMSLPTVWTLVCLHVLLAKRPTRWALGYTVLAIVLLGAGMTATSVA